MEDVLETVNVAEFVPDPDTEEDPDSV